MLREVIDADIIMQIMLMEVDFLVFSEVFEGCLCLLDTKNVLKNEEVNSDWDGDNDSWHQQH